VPAGWCLALVADAGSGLVFPRRVVEVSPGRYWLVDMGGWEPGRGRLLEFELPARGGAPSPPAMKVVADKLDRPHGLALGPDGRVYVGEAARIWRTRPTLPLVVEPVITGMPSDGAHPLKEIVFGARGQMFVNVGSSSDACAGAAGAMPVPCPDRAGATPRGAVYEATLGGPGFTLQSFKPYATGLRNSMALAWAAPGVLLQGENSIDYREADSPPEELNTLHRGADYGWPYCVGVRQPARGYEKRFDCKTSEPPALLWPAHAAPLQMIAVPAEAKNASPASSSSPGTATAPAAIASSASRSTPAAARAGRRGRGSTAGARSATSGRSARRPEFLSIRPAAFSSSRTATGRS